MDDALIVSGAVVLAFVTAAFTAVLRENGWTLSFATESLAIERHGQTRVKVPPNISPQSANNATFRMILPFVSLPELGMKIELCP